MKFVKPFLLITLLLLCFLQKSEGQVNADFSANLTSGCESLAVSFTDNSNSTAGDITNWEWDLGGVTVFTMNAGRIFPVGTYEVCLTVTDAAGNTDTECKADFINVFENPVAAFSIDASEGCSPLAVEFTDLSTSADGAITSWLWGVGGSNGVIEDDGTLTEILNVYDLPDVYDISLTIENENGCVGTITENNIITVFPDPSIQIVASDSFQCTPPFLVNFTNLNIEPNVDYLWNFGNGINYAGETPPAVSFNQPGEYDIRVIGVNNVTGCRDTLIVEDYISVGFPVEFTHTPNEVCLNEEISFEDISPGVADSVIWNFGDGNSSTAANPSHTYMTAGCYTATLTRFENNCETTVPVSSCITVKSLPSVTYTVDQNRACSLPHAAQFTGFSNGVSDWFWEFGDDGAAGTSTQQNPSITFTEFGIYPIHLTVTDFEGCSRTITQDTMYLIELNAALPDGQIMGCSPLTFTLQDESATPTAITTWEWEINTPSGQYTSTEASPTFTIPDTGCYDVQLIVTNTLGCRDTSLINDAFCGGLVPDVNFEAMPTPACVDADVSFTNLSSEYITEYFWDFGDDAFSFDSDPVHEYKDTGFFDVRLTVFHHGCANELFLENYIETLPPKARFKIEQVCSDPYTINLTENSIGADTRFFDFGDLSVTTDTSSASIVSYTFPDTGVYNILLVTENFTTGCTDSALVAYYITDPKADFSFSANEGCAPMIIDVVDNSVFAEHYQWVTDGGVFSNDTIAEPTVTFDTAGSYSAFQLIITDEHDCTDTLDFPNTVEVNAIDVNFQANPSAGCLPLTVQLQDNSANLFANNISWEWIVGDSLFLSTQQNPTFVFDSVGIYPVTLIVTDSWGCQSISTVDSLIYATMPVARFNADTLGCTLAEIKFNNPSLGDGLSYEWDFGDNNTSTQKGPKHTYASEGTYTVCLTVTDINGCTSTECKEDFIRIANPVAAFTADNNFGACPPLIVNFENLSQNATSYQWDFGDSSGVSNIVNAPHVYTVPGMFDVSLIAISTETCQDTLLIEDFISLEGPVGDFSFVADDNCIPTSVTFTAESNDLYLYVWDYGDGVLDTTGMHTSDTVVHFYNQTLNVNPSLILIDGQGCNRVITSPDSLELVTLVPEFQASDTILCGGDNVVTFNNLTNTTAPLEVLAWTFESGTPATSFDLSPTVTFGSIGAFDVTLIVSNGFCTDTLIREDFIKVGEVPTAAFTPDPAVGCEPLPVALIDQSTVNTGFIAGWNWQFGDGDSSILQNPQHSFNANNQMPVQLTVTTDLGCTDSVTQMLTIFPRVEMSADYAVTVCMGEPAQLGIEFFSDTTGVTYAWQNEPTLSCTDCLDPLALPTDTTTYTFMATSVDGCTYFTDVTVQVRPDSVPNILISNDTLICANDATQIFVSGGDDAFGYEWDIASPGLSCYNCINPIASPSVDMTYQVTVTNLSGCSSTDTVRISIQNEFQTFAGPDRTICLGDTIHLQTQIGNNPTWLNTENLSCTFCPNPIASPTEDISYVVRVVTDFGCEIFDSVNVKVLSELDIDAGDAMGICEGQTVQLTGFGDGVPTWSPAGSLSNELIFNPIASPTTPTTYYLSVESGDCILTDSVSVDILQKTEIELLDVTICEGEAIALQPIGFADMYNWSPSTGITSTTSETPLASPNETTEYTIIASLGTCEPDTASAFVNVIPKPIVNVASVYRFFPGENVLLDAEVLGTGNYAYQWVPAIGLSCTDCPNPIATGDSTRTYTVFITDIDTDCSLSKEVQLVLENECYADLIAVPNGFTPNEDGNNDELQMYSGTVDEIEYFRVFNRWGAVVYESNDRFFSWDGEYNGQKLPSGVYIYLLAAKCRLDGSTILKKGDITIYR